MNIATVKLVLITACNKDPVFRCAKYKCMYLTLSVMLSVTLFILVIFYWSLCSVRSCIVLL